MNWDNILLIISISANIAIILTLFATIFLIYKGLKANTKATESLIELIKINNLISNSQVENLTIHNYPQGYLNNKKQTKKEKRRHE